MLPTIPTQILPDPSLESCSYQQEHTFQEPPGLITSLLGLFPADMWEAEVPYENKA